MQVVQELTNMRSPRRYIQSIIRKLDDTLVVSHYNEQENYCSEKVQLNMVLPLWCFLSMMAPIQLALSES